MLLTTHNPTQRVSHEIVGYRPFEVKYICLVTGATKIERYAVVLTKREIEAEYDYIF